MFNSWKFMFKDFREKLCHPWANNCVRFWNRFLNDFEADRPTLIVRADRFATLLSEGLGEVVCPYGWV